MTLILISLKLKDKKKHDPALKWSFLPAMIIGSFYHIFEKTKKKLWKMEIIAPAKSLGLRLHQMKNKPGKWGITRKLKK